MRSHKTNIGLYGDYNAKLLQLDGPMLMASVNDDGTINTNAHMDQLNYVDNTNKPRIIDVSVRVLRTNDTIQYEMTPWVNLCWNTLNNPYHCQSNGLFTLGTSQKWTIPAKARNYYQNSRFQTVAQTFPLYNERYCDEIQNGVILSGFSGMAYWAATRLLRKGRQIIRDYLSYYSIQYSVDNNGNILGNTEYKARNYATTNINGESVGQHIHLLNIYETPLQSPDGILGICELHIFAGIGNDLAQTNERPISKVHATTTILCDVENTHSLFPNWETANLGVRRVYYRDYFQHMVDSETKSDLVMQTLQSGIREIIDVFKSRAKLPKLPYEPNHRKEPLDLNTILKALNIDRIVNIPPSAKWLALLSVDAENTRNTESNITAKMCAEEFGVFAVLAEASKVLTFAHTLLMVHVQAHRFESAPDAPSGVSLYDGILPFPTWLSPSNELGINKPVTRAVERPRPTEIFFGAKISENMQKDIHSIVFEHTWPQYQMWVDDNPDTFHQLNHPLFFTPRIREYINHAGNALDANRNIQVGKNTVNLILDVDYEIGPFLQNSTVDYVDLAENLPDLQKFNVILDQVFFAKFEGFVTQKVDAYRKEMITITAPYFGVLNRTASSLADPSSVHIVKRCTVELKALMIRLFGDVIVQWFTLHALWLNNNGINDVVFNHNNIPLNKLTSADIKKSQLIGLVALSSWYTAAQFVNSWTAEDNDNAASKSETPKYNVGSWVEKMMFNVHVARQYSKAKHDKLKLNQQQTVKIIVDEFKRDHHTIFHILALNSGKHHNEQLVNHHLNIWNQKLKSSDQSSRYHEWLQHLDGFVPVQFTDRILTDYMSTELFEQQFKRAPKQQDLNRYTSETLRRKCNDSTLSINGGFFLKYGNTIKVNKSNTDAVYIVGQSGTAKSLVRDDDKLNVFQVFWQPYTLVVPKFIHQLAPISNGMSDFPKLNRIQFHNVTNEPLNVLPKSKFLFNAPHECCFVTGASKTPAVAAIYAIDPLEDMSAILNGYSATLRLNAYPLAGSGCLLKGMTFLRAYRHRLNVSLQKFYSYLYGTHSKSAISKPIECSISEYRLHCRLLRALSQINKAILQMQGSSTAHGSEQGQNYFSPAHPIKVTMDGEKAPAERNNYTLEWHWSSQYKGSDTLVALQDHIHILYNSANKSWDHQKSAINGAGVLTLWLIMDNSQNHFKYTSVLAGRYSENNIIKLNQVSDTTTAITDIINTRNPQLVNVRANVQTLNDKIDIQVESLSKHTMLEDANVLNFYETVITKGDKKTSDFIATQAIPANAVHDETLHTMDFNSVPSFCTMRICTLNIDKTTSSPVLMTTDSYDTQLLDIVSDAIEKTAGECDLQILTVSGDIMPTITPELVCNISANDPPFIWNTHKQTHLRNQLQIDVSWMPHLLKVSQVASNKYMAGTYIFKHSQVFDDIDNISPNAGLFSSSTASLYGASQAYLIAYRYFMDLGAHYTETPLSRYYRPVSDIFKTIALTTNSKKQTDYISNTFGGAGAAILNKLLESYLSYNRKHLTEHGYVLKSFVNYHNTLDYDFVEYNDNQTTPCVGGLLYREFVALLLSQRKGHDFRTAVENYLNNQSIGTITETQIDTGSHLTTSLPSTFRGKQAHRNAIRSALWATLGYLCYQCASQAMNGHLSDLLFGKHGTPFKYITQFKVWVGVILRDFTSGEPYLHNDISNVHHSLKLMLNKYHSPFKLETPDGYRMLKSSNIKFNIKPNLVDYQKYGARHLLHCVTRASAHHIVYNCLRTITADAALLTQLSQAGLNADKQYGAIEVIPILLLLKLLRNVFTAQCMEWEILVKRMQILNPISWYLFVHHNTELDIEGSWSWAELVGPTKQKQNLLNPDASYLSCYNSILINKIMLYYGELKTYQNNTHSVNVNMSTKSLPAHTYMLKYEEAITLLLMDMYQLAEYSETMKSKHGLDWEKHITERRMPECMAHSMHFINRNYFMYYLNRQCVNILKDYSGFIKASLKNKVVISKLRATSGIHITRRHNWIISTNGINAKAPKNLTEAVTMRELYNVYLKPDQNISNPSHPRYISYNHQTEAEQTTSTENEALVVANILRLMQGQLIGSAKIRSNQTIYETFKDALQIVPEPPHDTDVISKLYGWKMTVSSSLKINETLAKEKLKGLMDIYDITKHTLVSEFQGLFDFCNPETTINHRRPVNITRGDLVKYYFSESPVVPTQYRHDSVGFFCFWDWIKTVYLPTLFDIFTAVSRIQAPLSTAYTLSNMYKAKMKECLKMDHYT